MTLTFDPAKDAINIAKHGVSLSRAAEMTVEVFRIDDRKDYGEARYRGFGPIEGRPHCLVVTYRDGMARVISLRPCHLKEYRRHVREAV